MYKLSVVARVMRDGQYCGFICRGQNGDETCLFNHQIDEYIRAGLIDITKDKRGYKFKDKTKRITDLIVVPFDKWVSNSSIRDLNGYKVKRYVQNIKTDGWIFDNSFLEAYCKETSDHYEKCNLVIVPGRYGADAKIVLGHIMQYMLSNHPLGREYLDYFRYIKISQLSVKDDTGKEFFHKLSSSGGIHTVVEGFEYLKDYKTVVDTLMKHKECGDIWNSAFVYMPRVPEKIQELKNKGCMIYDMVKGMKQSAVKANGK